MKQCPNPNCIFYTRLEELPDAYIKCPGCGGALVGVDSLSRKLATASTSRMKSSTSLYTPPRTFDEETSSHLLHPMDPDAFAPPGVDPYAADPYAFAQDDEEDPEGLVEAQPKWSATSKAIVVASALLLVASCAIVVVLLSNRLFPQARTITSAQATETAIAGMRPPVNTRIIAPPTNTLPAAAFPTVPQPRPPADTPTTQAVQPPTQVVVEPTPVPTTQVVAQPTAPTQQEITPGPTAPPPRTQLSGGIANAQMSLQLERGAPTGNVSAYNAPDPFNLAVQATFGAGAVTSITTRWYGPEGTQIYEMRKAYSQPGVYYTGFTLRKNTPWQTGDYRVDIYTNDAPTPAYSVTFSVVP